MLWLQAHDSFKARGIEPPALHQPPWPKPAKRRAAWVLKREALLQGEKARAKAQRRCFLRQLAAG